MMQRNSREMKGNNVGGLLLGHPGGNSENGFHTGPDDGGLEIRDLDSGPSSWESVVIRIDGC